MKQLALQLSSTLHWESATLVADATRAHLALAQHALDTDTDHTGAETEAILSLPAPLAPGASLALDLFYSGTVPRSTGRLERLGANAAQQQASDWDAITPDWTGVRGYGNVLWYPVASPQFFLAEGNALFEAIGHTRLDEQNARIHLRLSVGYAGEPPAAAYFCGRRAALKAAPDDPDASLAQTTGLATADFPSEPLGFRNPSLFLVQQAETLQEPSAGPKALGPAADAPGSFSSSASTSGTVPAPNVTPTTNATAAAPYLALETPDPGTIPGFAAASDRVSPLLREWLGERPLSALTAIDHPGQPFQDGPLLVAPLAVLQTSPESPALIQTLAHAWIQTGQPWMDDGLAQFFALLWIERERGRPAALAELHDLMLPVTVAEPDPRPGSAEADPGQPQAQPLIDARDDLFYRRKAGAVWWMLRGLVGDGNLHAALSAWRTQPPSQAPAREQALAFEHLLERLSSQDLSWFFADWVLRDHGLPDLTITDVAVASEPAGAGHPPGWLVAVTVRNEGGAVADVPLVVRSGMTQKEQRLRIAALSTVTQRVLVEAAPTAVEVNDGSTPELRSNTHTREIKLQTR